MKKLNEIKIDITVNVSKDKVWDLLFNQFGEVSVFNPIIDGSHHTKGTKGEVGCERLCQIDANTAVHEKIVSAVDGESFDIDIIEGGLPMMDVMKGNFTLEELSPSQTKAIMTMKFNTSPAFVAFLMKGMMRKMLYKMLVGLKYHLETGNMVTKENISEIMKDFKKLNNTEAFKDNFDASIAA